MVNASRFRFEQQVAVLVGLLCLAMIAAVSAGAVWIGRKESMRLISQDITGLAGNMAAALDETMSDRFREVRVVAGLSPLRTLWRTDPGEVRSVLNDLQTSLPTYTWIGFATPDGTVQAATQGMLEGASVLARPWFQDGLKGPYVGDVHEAKLLSKFLAPREQADPFRFVDIAMPVFDKTNAFVGVLGAHLSWAWADELRRRLLTYGGVGEESELWILSRDGQILLGPGIGSTPFDPARVRAMVAERRGLFEDARSGDPVLTGFALTSGLNDYPGLGWIVVTRRPVAVAFSSVRQTGQTILLLGLIMALVSIVLTWIVVRRAAAPMRQLTAAVGEIGRNPLMTMLPRLGGSREVVELSHSLRSLLRRIGHAERELHDIEERSARTAERFQSTIATLQHVADTDPLTGLLNRRAFLVFAEDAMTYYRRYGRTIAILVADIDFFKRVNDTYGHSAGDAVIGSIAGILTDAVRTSDKVARFGGEEFVILLREISDEAMMALAERIRAAVSAARVRHEGQDIAVTISIGAARVARGDGDIQALIERADQALYSAKSRGRDCVSLGPPRAISPLVRAA